jgi:hypothetical protein
MYIKKNDAKLLDMPLNAYSVLLFAIAILVMLFFGYKNVDPVVITVCLLLALGGFAEFIYIMIKRDKALKIIAKRRMQSIQRKRLKRASAALNKRASQES